MKRGHDRTAAAARTEDAVVALLRNHRGPQRAATWDQLARESGLNQRRLRAVATALDGQRWLLGVVMPEDARDGDPRGVFLCEHPDQARGLTGIIAAKATDELARIKRREDYAAALALWPARQITMDFEKGAAA